MLRRAFTMIELIFVIVVMGILGKFGTEFIVKAYDNFFFSTLQNRLQQQSEAAITQLAARLQYRIKTSVQQSTGGTQIDWVGMDIDGWRGTWNGTRNVPTWSGFINIDSINLVPNSNLIRSPETNTTSANTMINALSNNNTGLNNSAIIFTGASNPTSTIWDGAVLDQSGELAHPIMSNVTNNFQPSVDDFSGVDIYEFYKLAWSAYTVRLEGNDLVLYYDYQPWQGESITVNNDPTGQRSILMENVQSFQFQTVGDLIKIQVCVNDNNLAGGFSVCKEKTVF